jgi:hypothetical protein
MAVPEGENSIQRRQAERLKHVRTGERDRKMVPNLYRAAYGAIVFVG